MSVAFVIVVIVFILGAIIGSYVACQYDRVKAGWSMKDASVKPSQCLSCGHKIKPWHNIPLVSYVWQKGRCVYCGAPIPAHVFWIELGVAILAVCLYIIIS